MGLSTANRERMGRMRAFFEGVGHGDGAGIWEDTPADHSTFRDRYLKKVEKRQRAAKAEEMI